MLVQSPIVRLAVTLVLVAGGLSGCARRATAESTTTDNGCRAWLHRSETRLAVASRHPDFEIWWISPSFSGEAEWTFRGTFCRARLHRVRGLPIPSESTKIGASHPVPFLPTLCKRGGSPESRRYSAIFDSIPDVGCIRLLYLVRATDADHNLAVIAADDPQKLSTTTDRVQSDPVNGCTTEASTL